ncbi:MAG: hypothetical protein MUE60_07210 [Candidatus Eisenbacteria bacterium]|nr:hypothetical protein [Candidatus Eisenbacteria bacterium]
MKPSRYAAVVLSLILSHAAVLGIPALRADRASWARWPMIDDAFYYLQPAWNLAHGRGLTLDGMSPTNGFHPLWMLVLSATALVAPSKMVFFDTVRALSLIVFYAACLSFASLALAIFESRALMISALVLYLGIPHLFAAHMNGLETGLALLLTVLVLRLMVQTGTSGRVSAATTASLGALTALLFLTRTDAIATILPVWGIWVFGSLRSYRTIHQSERLGSEFLRQATMLTLPWVLLVAPWCAWCWARFGRIVQSSAYVDPIIMRRYYATHFDFDQTGWHHLFAGQAWSEFSEVMSKSNIGLSLPMFLGIVGSALTAAFLLPLPRVHRRFLAVTAVLVGSLSALVLVHVVVRLTFFNGWYYYPSQLLLMCAILWVTGVAIHARTAWARVVVGSMLVISMVFLVEASARPYAILRDTVSASAQRHARGHRGSRGEPGGLPALGIGKVAPDSAVVVGTSDSGALAFFAPDNVAVVNLDGLINEAAARAIAEGRLGDYILSTPISRTQIRAPLSQLESVMGHRFRGHFRTRSITNYDWLAETRGSARPEDFNLSLPASGRIRPAEPEGWMHLIGEWRGVTGEGLAGQCRVGVKDFGVRFATHGGTASTCLVVWASPYPDRLLTFDIFLDELQIGTLGYQSGQGMVRWGKAPPSQTLDDSWICVDMLDTLRVDLGKLGEGMHEVVLRNQESLSPYVLGLANDHAIYSCMVAEFRIVESSNPLPVDGALSRGSRVDIEGL